MNAKNVLLSSLMTALCLAAAPAWADAVLDRARALIDGGRGAEAYPMLAPEEHLRRGEAEFDLLLGVAAFEAGENTRALLALERVLAVEPGNARARAEIARVYLAIGDTATARQEFENVKRQGVPPAVSRSVEKFLEAVERLEDVIKPTLKAYVEGTLGIDDNVNTSMGSSSQAIPGLGGVIVQFGPGASQTADTFASLGAGLRYRNPFEPGLAFVAGLSVLQRSHANDREYNIAVLDGSAGLVKTVGNDVYSLTAQVNDMALDNHGYRSAIGVTGQWQRNFSTREQVTGYLQYSDLNYGSFKGADQGVRDAHRWVAGGAYARTLEGGWVVYAGGYLGVENEKAADVPHLGHDLFGVRTGGELAVREGMALFVNFAFEHRRHGGEWPLFLTKRKDDQYSLNFGANIVPAKNWLLIPQVSLTINNSNVSMMEYRRNMASVTLRRDF